MAGCACSKPMYLDIHLSELYNNSTHVFERVAMTTVFLTEKGCFVCGQKNRYPQVAPSMTILGTKDLDGRPSQMQRSAVYMWIQRCIFCGYCAVDISSGVDEDKSIVSSPEYSSQLVNPEYPETTNAFLCRALSSEKSGRFDDAGWAAVYGSWICDDNKFSASADLCRSRALKLFFKAHAAGQHFGESPEEEDVLLVDLMRRRGDFEAAGEICKRELSKPHSEEVMDLFYFESKLVEAKNRLIHTVDEAREFDD